MNILLATDMLPTAPRRRIPMWSECSLMSSSHVATGSRSPRWPDPVGAGIETDGHVPIHRIAGWSRALQPFLCRSAAAVAPDDARSRDGPRAHEARPRRLRPDVVHSHSWMLHSSSAFLPTVGTRVVVTMHEYSLVCPKGTFVHTGGTV